MKKGIRILCLMLTLALVLSLVPTMAFAEGTATPTTHIVTFDSNGHGTAPATQNVESGNKAIEPTALTEEGWTFGGWYSDAALTIAYNFNDAVTNNITLYAKWSQNITNIAVTITAPVLGATPDYNYTFTTTPSGDTMYNVFAEWYKLAEADYTNGVGDDWGSPMDHDETFTTGYYYAPAFRFMAKPGYALATNITATVNGQPHASGYGSVYQRPSATYVYAYVTYDYEPLTAASPTVAIVEGNGQEWTKGTATGISFKSTADFDDFTQVEVDGNVVARENYTAVEGSTIVTLNASYLETLSVGRHRIVIQSANDRPEALFTIKDGGSTHTHSGGNWKSDGIKHWKECSCGAILEEAAHADKNNDNKCDTCGHNMLPVEVPKTGDDNNILLYGVLMLLALAGMMGTTVIGKRKRV